MVTITLKAQYVSLIITIISFICEVTFIAALQTVNSTRECHLLKRKKPLRVRNYRYRVKLIALISALLFLGLEVLVSFFSDPVQLERFKTEPCVRVDSVRKLQGPQGEFREADFLEGICQTLRGDLNYVLPGNVSLEDGQVQCSKEPVYVYDLVSVSERKRLPRATAEARCEGNVCVFVFQEEKQKSIYFSTALPPDFVEDLRSATDDPEMEFLKTELLFDTSELLPIFAGRAVDAFLAEVNDPYELRRRVFLGSAKVTCPFVEKVVDATSVPRELLFFLLVAWIVGLSFFLASLALRRKVFFDVGNPLHWATLVQKPVDEAVEHDPVVCCKTEDEALTLYVHERGYQVREDTESGELPTYVHGE